MCTFRSVRPKSTSTNMAAPPPPPPMPTAAPSMAALPPGWQQFKTAQGQIYFANAATGQSSYTPPTAMPALPAGFSSALVAASPPPMPVAGPSTATAPADQGQGKKKSKAKSKVPIEGTKWLKVTVRFDLCFCSELEVLNRARTDQRRQRFLHSHRDETKLVDCTGRDTSSSRGHRNEGTPR